MNRKEFIGGIGALTVFDVLALPKDEKPYLKLGVFSDTHIKQDSRSCELTAGAFKVFKASGVNAISHLGDLADLHYAEAYTMYRACIDETFPDETTRPELIYCYANHDILNPVWDRAKQASPPHLEQKVAFADMRKRLGIDHDFFCERKIGGITFIAIPESVNLIGGWEFVRARITAACRKSPSKPVVVMSHRPPSATTNQSSPDGSDELRAILDGFPQVICLHGHTHMPLVNETNIWQGEFTAINCGCLYEWFGRGVASPFSANYSYWVGVIEFYSNRLLVRRYDVRTGCEVLTDSVWCVPLPFAAKTAPYVFSAARAREPKIGYPKDSALKVFHVGAPHNELRVWVPDSVDETKVAAHRLRAYERQDGGWKVIAFQDRLSEFHLVPGNSKGGVWINLSEGYFKSNTDYRLTATPIGFYGTEGKPIGAKWKSPDLTKTETRWICEEPMAKLEAMIDKRPIVKQDGWWEVPDGKQVTIALPKEIWDVPVGTRLRFDYTVEIEQNREDQEGWLMYLTPANGYWRKAAIMRLVMPSGKGGDFRYVKEFAAQGVEFAHMISFTAKFGGRFRLKSVKLEKVL